MKKLFYILLLILFLASPAWGTTYYMRSDGTAANKAAATGCGSASTAMSESKHNSESFSAGDEIHMCDTGGNYTSQIVPPSSGSAGNYITYKNASGDSPNIDMGGSSNSAMHIEGKDYIIVDGIEMQDSADSGALEFVGGASYCIVINCKIHHNIYRGIFYTASDHLTFGQAGNGNEIYNNTTGTAGGDIVGSDSDDIIVQYNKLYADDSNWGVDGFACHSTDGLLIQYNTIYGHNKTGDGEDGVDLKCWTRRLP